MPKKIDERTAKRIIAMYQQCQNGYEVARVVGVAVPTVYNVLKIAGIERTGKTGRARASDEEIVRSYRRTGNGIVTATKLKVSDKTVYEVLAKHGVKTKPGPDRRFDGEQEQKIASLYTDGWSASKLARRYRCTAWTILAVLNRLGIERNRRSPLDLTSAEKETARAMWKTGSNFQEITIALRRTGGTVSRYLRSLETIRARPMRSGPGATSWKGGRHLHGSGYWYVWIAPDDAMASMRNNSGHVLEHRLVMARALGRPLRSSESVHHINGVRADNRIENLQLRHDKHGKGGPMICLDCGSHNVGHAPITED